MTRPHDPPVASDRMSEQEELQWIHILEYGIPCTGSLGWELAAEDGTHHSPSPMDERTG